METFLVVVAMLIVAGFFAVVTVIRNTYVCSPNEVLIFSGRRFRLNTPAEFERTEVGFRVVRGGRAMRVPIIERVDRMSLTNIPIELSVKNAFSRGGIPLNVHAVANIKFPSEEPLLHNALERFLGCSQDQIVFTAKDTLEGNLRGVIAELTPEEINQKKGLFQQKLVEEAHRDMQRLGLVLDNLQIQNISDDVGYLNSVGRVRGAQVRSGAKIGEVRAQTTSIVQRAKTNMNAELSKLETDITLAAKENERRQLAAKRQGAARLAEVRGEVVAQIAEARAQVKSWDARAEQIRRKLEADVVTPAEAQKQQLEEQAKAQAAGVLAQGRAAAAALEKLAEVYVAHGDAGRDALLVQKLQPVFEEIMGTMKHIGVSRFTVLGQSNGAGAGQSGGIGAAVFGANEQLKALTGTDVLAKLTGGAGAQRASASPPVVARTDTPAATAQSAPAQAAPARPQPVATAPVSAHASAPVRATNDKAAAERAAQLKQRLRDQQHERRGN